MAKTNLKKNANGYSYKYTDLASIHDYLESEGITYYQYIEPIDGVDYMYTVPIFEGEAAAPRRGCRLADAKLQGKANAAQEQGSAITYARRYSLLMAFGLATTDNDAMVMTTYESNADGRKAEAKDKAGLVAEIERLMPMADITEENILSQANVKKLYDMKVPQMVSCVDWLKGIIARNGGQK